MRIERKWRNREEKEEWEERRAMTRLRDETGKTKEEWEGRRESREQEMVKWRRIRRNGRRE